VCGQRHLRCFFGNIMRRYRLKTEVQYRHFGLNIVSDPNSQTSKDETITQHHCQCQRQHRTVLQTPLFVGC